MGRLRRVSTRARLALAGVAIAVSAAGVGAYAATQQPAIKTFTPRSANQITNLDVLRQQIRNYYGDPLGTGQFGANSNYAKEARSVARRGERYLKHRLHERSHRPKAIVLD